jgi:Phage integrase family
MDTGSRGGRRPAGSFARRLCLKGSKRPLVRVGAPARAGAKAERGAGSADPAPRSGAALDRMSGWKHAAEVTGVPHVHFHDLRHTGNTFAAASGVGIKDLMTRMGHDSERAAMIYQHEARGADRAITSAIDHMSRPNAGDRQARTTAWAARSPRRANGTLMARRPHGEAATGRNPIRAVALTSGFGLERAKGIEPS